MIYVILVIFLILFLFPPLTSYTYYKRNKTSILSINQGYVKDPRYFSKSLRNMVESQLPYAKDKTIKLSREEKYLDEKDISKMSGDVQDMVICNDKVFVNSDITSFEKEVFCAEDSRFTKPGLTARSIYGKKRILLGNGIDIVRWVDAEESLTVYDDCDLGISATAGRALCVGYNCTFQRLFAPCIYLGQRPDKTSNISMKDRNDVLLMSPNKERKHNVRFISKRMIDENGVCDYSILSWRNVTLNEGIILKGDIRSHKGVRICKDAVVIGNIFAEDDVLLEEGALVLGNILAQGSVHLLSHASVGTDGQISSIIARDNVRFDGCNIVYGYISSEHGGSISDRPETEAKQQKFTFLKSVELKKNISFADRTEYEEAALKGFRKDDTVETIVIPEGVEIINHSLCFACKALSEAVIPTSVKVIEPYAFADCGNLTSFGELENACIEEIGTSAFENDEKLVSIHFPSTLRTIGPAAFAGCMGLTKIEFERDACIREIKDHCFRDCIAIHEIYLPDSVEVVGISSFLNCISLEKISISNKLLSQPGIEELKKILPNVKIEVREENPDEEDKNTSNVE